MIELNELAKKLGLAKRHIMRLVYMPNSTLKYEHIEDKKYFDETEVLELLKKGGSMKYLLVTIWALLVIGVGVVYAEGLEEHPVKLAIAYNIDGNNAEEAIGSAAKPDIFGIKGLDYDFLVLSEIGETLTSDDKTVLNGLSYNYDFNEKIGVFTGVGIGLSRLEKLAKHRLGESDKYVYAGLSYKF